MTIDIFQENVYSRDIIYNSTKSNYSVTHQRTLVLDTAENLMQIGVWCKDGSPKERKHIQLFLQLTRKNLDALLCFPLSKAFTQNFTHVCTSFTQMEKEYSIGSINFAEWATTSIHWSKMLTKNIHLL